MKQEKRLVILWSTGQWVTRSLEGKWSTHSRNQKYARHEILHVPLEWTNDQIENFLRLRKEIGEGIWL